MSSEAVERSGEGFKCSRSFDRSSRYPRVAMSPMRDRHAGNSGRNVNINSGRPAMKPTGGHQKGHFEGSQLHPKSYSTPNVTLPGGLKGPAPACENDVIPMELLVEYAEYHNMVSAHQQQIQYQIQEMQNQYAQYQAMLERMESVRFSPQNLKRLELQQQMPGCPRRQDSGESHSSSPLNRMVYRSLSSPGNDVQRQLTHASLNYGMTAPCSPHDDSPLSSSDNTPITNEQRGISAGSAQSSRLYQTLSPEALKEVHGNECEETLRTMSSFSTVDTVGEEGFRTLSTNVSYEDMENGTAFGQQRPWHFPERAIPQTPMFYKRFNDGPFTGTQRFMPPDADYYQDDLVLEPYVNHNGLGEFMLNHPNPELRRIPSGSAMRMPVVNGRINLDYYKRDFLARAAEQGIAHLFINLDMDQPRLRFRGGPIPQAGGRIVQCGSGGNSGSKPAAGGRSTAHVANGIRFTGYSHDGGDYNSHGSRSMESNGSDESEEERFRNSGGPDAELRRRCREAGDDLGDEYDPEAKKKARRNAPQVRARIPNYYMQDDLADADLEYRAVAQTLKELEVGGIMIINKRRSQKESQITVKKATKSYDYLLDIPLLAEPDPELGDQQYKCIVPGVYWDKRSWIASWYDQGNRCYSSFSAKMHGFYKAKYFAIHVRMYKTKNNAKPLDEDAVERERMQLMKYFDDNQCAATHTGVTALSPPPSEH